MGIGWSNKKRRDKRLRKKGRGRNQLKKRKQ